MRLSSFVVAMTYCRDLAIGGMRNGLAVRQRNYESEKAGFAIPRALCFETFPFPEPTTEQSAAISAAAKELDDLRSRG